MSNRLIFAVLLINSGLIWAQHERNVMLPSDTVISNYLTGSEAYTALYNGRTVTPYEITFTNHPYFETASYTRGTLCYNRVVYKEVLMRLDLYRDEISVLRPDTMVNIVLNIDRFDYAILNGAVIVKSVADRKAKEKYVVLLHNGTWPVVKIHNLTIIEELSGLVLRRSFRMEHQYAIYTDGALYPVRNKNSILRLFPSSKKELNTFARQHRLDFTKHTEQAIISLVGHYETMHND
jgi:hypothetical protein